VPRQPDPTALTPDEANTVRDLIRTVKSTSGLTSEELAERLGWDVRRVTNALSSSQTLLADRAAALLQAAAPKRGHGKAQGALARFFGLQYATHGWFARYKAAQAAPPAFIPPNEIPSVAAFLCDRLVEIGAIAKTKKAREQLNSGLTRVLKKEALRMAISWRSEGMTLVHRAVAAVETGKQKWLDPLGAPIIKGAPRHFAREVVSLLVDLAFQERKEQK
jgi:hypothetical protein